MKQPLNGLQARLRDRWYLHQARVAIARCNRNVARRRRLPSARTPAPGAHYFAPGVIEGGPRPDRAGLKPYLVTLAIALASVAFYVLRGGMTS